MWLFKIRTEGPVIPQQVLFHCVILPVLKSISELIEEKEYMEQLAEMTRLLFKLSEVKNIFSQAQIDHLPSPEDPKQALIQFLEGICIVCCQSQNQNAYLNQLLRNVIEQYIGRFLPTSPSVSDLGQHPVLLALRSPVSLPIMTPLKKHIVHAIRKSYLEFKGSSPPPRLASVLAFTLQLFKGTSRGVCDLELLLPGILKCLVLVNEPQVKKLATENLQCMIKTCQVGSEGEPATQLTSLFRQFIQDYGVQYSYQVYSILEVVAALSGHIVVHLVPTLTQSLKDSELKWGYGRNIAQRKVEYFEMKNASVL
ncbi:hypothetical protein U0070_013826 [Myodes glareolus]|uniref:MMS22-like C-terminal domain-containing protein n=1 Tax=Myodes glareolus TaxID=447135 RepID=A0AAW0IDZ8_MYOGA